MGTGRAGTEGVLVIKYVTQNRSKKAAKTASRTGSGVLRAVESQIRGHYTTIVIGTNYYIDRRREEYFFILLVVSIRTGVMIIIIPLNLLQEDLKDRYNKVGISCAE